MPPRVRRVPGYFVDFGDGHCEGGTGGDPDTDLQSRFSRPLPEDPVFEVGEAADAQARDIPGWASWTEEEAKAWYDAAVTEPLGEIPDIASMSPAAFQNNAQAIVAQLQGVIAAQTTVTRNLARMAIALRNKTWPQLEGS